MESVSVNIYNSEYKLRGDDPEQIRSAATLVDQKMRSVASRVPMQPATTTAVLAALNTAEELISAKADADAWAIDMIERLNRLEENLNSLISSG